MSYERATMVKCIARVQKVLFATSSLVTGWGAGYSTEHDPRRADRPRHAAARRPGRSAREGRRLAIGGDR
jgi:hypothetical protein